LTWSGLGGRVSIRRIIGALFVHTPSLLAWSERRKQIFIVIIRNVQGTSEKTKTVVLGEGGGDEKI